MNHIALAKGRNREIFHVDKTIVFDSDISDEIRIKMFYGHELCDHLSITEATSGDFARSGSDAVRMFLMVSRMWCSCHMHSNYSDLVLLLNVGLNQCFAQISSPSHLDIFEILSNIPPSTICVTNAYALSGHADEDAM